jgi:hypothetical protein
MRIRLGGGEGHLSMCVTIRYLGGSRDMPPPGNFCMLDTLRLLLVHFRALI